MRLLLLGALAFLVACPGPQGRKADKPAEAVVTEVAVTKTVPVPSGLTLACYNESPKEATAREAKRLALVRLASIEECTRRMCRIASIGRQGLDCDAKDLGQVIRALGQADVQGKAVP